MKITLPLFLLLLIAAQAHAAQIPSTSAATAASPSTARSFIAPIPLSTGWVEGFLLLIVWLFVVAILIGPLISYFRLEPRCLQRFSDDKKIRT